MFELVFATNNPNKFKEVAAAFPSTIKLLTLAEAGFAGEIPETGNTLVANALQKARFIYQATHKNCFADDTGLEVEALNGAPGVYSARYAGVNATADENMNLLLQNLASNPNKKARFTTVFALIIDAKEYLFEGSIDGEILPEKTGDGGFGYDPIFKPVGYSKSFAQMTLDEKKLISHRGIALKEMVGFFKEKNPK
ncbi:MAG: RdgB/HAM1 family non-canonical purine NTP pyrophosphatase [Bacteroidetes bacterium]|nr:RdgB/HAM1 family non-canonical purine NTP pyrophosphatase [Bacteroidota bacterium]